MSMSTTFDASIDAVELDLLCTYAQVSAPYPLRARSVGATTEQRQASFRAAKDRLAARGLADDQGPLGVADAFVHLLRGAKTTFDLTLAIGADRLGAVLLGYRGQAVLAVAELDADEPTASLIARPIDDAVDELLLLIPDLDAAMITPMSLPRQALAGAYRELLRRGEAGQLGTHEVDDLLRSHGIDDRLANRMVTQLLPVLGSGQAGLAERGGYAGDWRRASEELRWLDTERGRFRLAGTREWTSVNPLFANELIGEIRRMCASIGG
jgi:hypothetical protein